MKTTSFAFPLAIIHSGNSPLKLTQKSRDSDCSKCVHCSLFHCYVTLAIVQVHFDKNSKAAYRMKHKATIVYILVLDEICISSTKIHKIVDIRHIQN